MCIKIVRFASFFAHIVQVKIWHNVRRAMFSKLVILNSCFLYTSKLEQYTVLKVRAVEYLLTEVSVMGIGYIRLRHLVQA